MTMANILFVCMGNICRSPTAEGVFTALIQAQGVADRFEIDSAGSHDYHRGSAPDSRAMSCAEAHGYNLKGLRARPVCSWDFDNFDYILAMDKDNLAFLESEKPSQWQGQLSLMLDYHSSGVIGSQVPDPYYGGDQGFDAVIAMLEDSCQGLLNHILAQHA